MVPPGIPAQPLAELPERAAPDLTLGVTVGIVSQGVEPAAVVHGPEIGLGELLGNELAEPLGGPLSEERTVLEAAREVVREARFQSLEVFPRPAAVLIEDAVGEFSQDPVVL